MSHSKVVDYCRFYNRTEREKRTEYPCASTGPRVDVLSISGRFGRQFPTQKPGDFGQTANLIGLPALKPGSARSASASRPTTGREESFTATPVPPPSTENHLRYDKLVGLSMAGQQRLHVFQQLPGRTFNHNTMTQFLISGRSNVKK